MKIEVLNVCYNFWIFSNASLATTLAAATLMAASNRTGLNLVFKVYASVTSSCAT